MSVFIPTSKEKWRECLRANFPKRKKVFVKGQEIPAALLRAEVLSTYNRLFPPSAGSLPNNTIRKGTLDKIYNKIKDDPGLLQPGDDLVNSVVYQYNNAEEVDTTDYSSEPSSEDSKSESSSEPRSEKSESSSEEAPSSSKKQVELTVSELDTLSSSKSSTKSTASYSIDTDDEDAEDETKSPTITVSNTRSSPVPGMKEEYEAEQRQEKLKEMAEQVNEKMRAEGFLQGPATVQPPATTADSV